MNREDQRVIAIARILRGLRIVLGLAPDTRADLSAAFTATDADLEQLREALGNVIAADKQRTRRTRQAGSLARGKGH